MHLLFQLLFVDTLIIVLKTADVVIIFEFFGGISDHFPRIQKECTVVIFFFGWFCNGILIIAEDVDITLILTIVCKYKYLTFFEVPLC